MKSNPENLVVGLASQSKPAVGLFGVDAVSLSGRTILVVEDEPLIALEICEALKGAGASALCAHWLKHALPLADHSSVAAAVLDFGRSDGEASELCARLKQRGIPFVLYSGYPRIADVCRSAIAVPKRSPPKALVDALHQALMTAGR